MQIDAALFLKNVEKGEEGCVNLLGVSHHILVSNIPGRLPLAFFVQMTLQPDEGNRRNEIQIDLFDPDGRAVGETLVEVISPKVNPFGGPVVFARYVAFNPNITCLGEYTARVRFNDEDVSTTTLLITGFP